MKKVISIFLLLLVFIISIFYIKNVKAHKNKFEVAQVNSKLEINFMNLNNKKIGWGIKRKESNQQPDLGDINKRLIDSYNGISMGNNDDKSVYLTFDLGYEAGYMPKILSALKENNVKATFFLAGHYFASEPELVNQIIKEGHIIGNHTNNHKSMPELSIEDNKKEIMDLHTMVCEKFSYEMKYFRPPKGEYSERTLALTNSLGYKTVMWSFAYDDWIDEKQGREEYAKDKIIKNIHNGAVLLLHGTSKDNANILNEIIKEIKNMGYQFKNLDEFN